MKPLVIAHRGASGYAPENTRAAFLKALLLDAGAIEFDIQPAKDNVLVVFHDHKLKRTTGERGSVSDYTLKQLKQLDCGSWFGRLFAGEKILTFEEALKLIGNRKRIFIDIKDKYLKDPEETALQIMMQLRKSRITVPVTLAGEFHIIDPFIAKHKLRNVSLQYYHFRLKDPLKSMADLNYVSIHASCILATKKLIKRAHKRGLKVYSWVLNTKEGMRKQILRGVDGIYTNYPDRLQEAIDELNKGSDKEH
jgi:glycerophosphoryl diester phosphodiesterase